MKQAPRPFLVVLVGLMLLGSASARGAQSVAQHHAAQGASQERISKTMPAASRADDKGNHAEPGDDRGRGGHGRDG